MGDRFYNQQANYKPKRRLKKDCIAEFQEIIGIKVPGLERMTIANIENLTSVVNKVLNEAYKTFSNEQMEKEIGNS